MDQMSRSTENQADWIEVTNPTSGDIESLADQHDIPRDMFVTQYFPENITEIEHFHSDILGECLYLVLINYKANKPHSVEKGLYPITFIFNQKQLITITDKKDQSIKPSIENQLGKEVQPDQLVIGYILNMYHLYIGELNQLKKTIDEISELARTSTNRDILLNLSDVERDMVFLEQTLDDQKDTIEHLFNSELFQSMESEQRQIHEIRKKMKKTDKLIDLYRDLIDTTGGLISEMIDSKLNGIMEYLDSAQLVIAIPTLIFSLWGINTGGLAGTDTRFGSIAVVFLAIFLGLSTYLYLKKKEY